MKVYLVTSGKYEDYSVDAICSSREIAERTLKLMGNQIDPYNEIEEIEVDEVHNLVPFDCVLWKVSTDKDGNIIGKVERSFIYNKNSIGAAPRKGNYTFCVLAKNEEKAKKVADVWRLRVIRANGWFEGENAWNEWMTFIDKHKDVNKQPLDCFF